MRKLETLALFLVVSGCTPFVGKDAVDDAQGGESASTTTDPTKPGPPPASAPASGAAPAPTPVSGGLNQVKSGVVSVTQSISLVDGRLSNQWVASASFAETSVGEAAGHACTISAEGACSIIECVTGGVPLMPLTAPHAGEITITGAQTLQLVPDERGAYPAKIGQTHLFTAGADLTFVALGGPAPAFERTFKAPSLVKVTAPEWPLMGGPLAIDRDQGLGFEWTGGGEGLVNVAVSSVVDGNVTIVTCKFPANEGQGLVPAEAMGRFAATDTATVSVNSSSAENVEQDGWNITLQAMIPSKSGQAIIK